MSFFYTVEFFEGEKLHDPHVDKEGGKTRKGLAELRESCELP